MPDLQVPFHDQRAVATLSRFIKKFNPDQVITLGDEIDLPQISKWTEGTPGQYEQTLNKDRWETHNLLYDLRVTDMIRSNHTDRLYNTIMRKVPAFLALPELTLPGFLYLDELNIKYHQKPYEFAPGWIAVHGDEQGINPNAGLTALGAARRHGKNVICGHTHRAGQSAFTEASGGVLGRVLKGIDAGHLMDLKKAGFTKGTANWQQAFVVVYVDNKRVNPVLTYFEKDGSFIFEGKVYN